MNLFDIPPDAKHTALRALKTIAIADGRFETAERALLAAAAATYGVDAGDLDALAPVSPEDLAALVEGAQARQHVLHACMLMSLADQAVAKAEAAALESFRRALAVDESKMKIVEDLAKGHLTFARLHAISSGRAGIRSQANDTRLSNMLRVFGVLPADDALSARFQALAELPDGTLGREYVRYREKNRFPWPGAKGGMTEGLVHHDLTHVLTGYDTDPIGEIQIGAFTAGMKQTDPFMFLFFPMLEFHVGLAIRPGQPAFPGNYDAALAFKAHAAGARCALDLTNHWEFWSVMDRPITSLRDEYRIDT